MLGTSFQQANTSLTNAENLKDANRNLKYDSMLLHTETNFFPLIMYFNGLQCRRRIRYLVENLWVYFPLGRQENKEKKLIVNA